MLLDGLDRANKMVVNVSKTKVIIFYTKVKLLTAISNSIMTIMIPTVSERTADVVDILYVNM
jgi:hypothetical protein